MVGGGEKWFLFVLNTADNRAVYSYVNEYDSLETEKIRRLDRQSKWHCSGLGKLWIRQALDSTT